MQLVRAAEREQSGARFALEPQLRPDALRLGTADLLDLVAAALNHGYRLIGVEALDSRLLALGSEAQERTQQRLLERLESGGFAGLQTTVEQARPGIAIGAIRVVGPDGRTLRMTRSGEIDTQAAESAQAIATLLDNALPAG